MMKFGEAESIRHPVIRSRNEVNTSGRKNTKTEMGLADD